MKLYRLFLEVMMLGIVLGVAAVLGHMKSPEQFKESLGAYVLLRAAIWILIEANLPRRKPGRPPLESTLDLPEYFVGRDGIARRRNPDRW